MTLDDLRKAHARASVALREAQVAVGKDRDRRLDEFKRQLDAELEAKHGPGVRAARDAYWETKAALDAELSRLAMSGEGAPYPLGTRLYEWVPESEHCWSSHRRMVLSGRVGVVEAVTTENIGEFVKPLGYCASAAVGGYAVRILKKNGTPGKLYFTLSSSWFRDCWLPEGVKFEEADDETTH